MLGEFDLRLRLLEAFARHLELYGNAKSSLRMALVNVVLVFK